MKRFAILGIALLMLVATTAEAQDSSGLVDAFKQAQSSDIHGTVSFSEKQSQQDEMMATMIKQMG